MSGTVPGVLKFDGVVESPIYCVAAIFQKLGILQYCLVSEKPLRLVYGTFYDAIGDTTKPSKSEFLLCHQDLMMRLLKSGSSADLEIVTCEAYLTPMFPITHKKFKAAIKNFKGKNNCLVVGLTGGIASGKSTVSDILEELGAPLIDFDLIARQVVEPGTYGFEAIVNYFGKQILTENGTLDRKKLSKIVFQDFKKRKKLESFTHPLIYEEFFKQINTIAQKDPDAVIQVSIPLLIEQGMQHAFDNLIIVYVSQKTQVERLAQRDGISIKEASNILKSQLPIDEKVGFANFIINNENTIEETRKQVNKVWQELINIQKW